MASGCTSRAWLMDADRIERDGEALAMVDELTAVLVLLTAAADRAEEAGL